VLRYAALVLLLACKQSAPPPPPVAAGPSCDDVAAKMRTVLADETRDVGSAGAAMLDRMLGAFTDACREDRWPADVRSCIVAAKDRTAADGCRGKLPAELRQKLDERVTRAVAPPTTN